MSRLSASRRKRTSTRVVGASASRVGEPVAARDGALFDASQIERATLTRLPTFGGPVLRVDAAYSDLHARWHHSHRVARAHLPENTVPVTTVP